MTPRYNHCPIETNQKLVEFDPRLLDPKQHQSSDPVKQRLDKTKSGM